MNPALDLGLERVMRATRQTVWDAWTDPVNLEQWWLPAPMRCRVERLEVVPGGAFVTSMSDDGVEFAPHLDLELLDRTIAKGAAPDRIALVRRAIREQGAKALAGSK